MATKPKIVTLTNSSVDILNVIRNNATINYKNYVPVATADAESIREIGAIIMDSPQLQNEFLSALVNRIGRVLVTSKMYDNPWSMFKKGTLEFGATIEEIFVNIAKYAYPNSDGVATIEAKIDDSKSYIEITFIDNGIEYNPLEKEDPDLNIPLSDRPIGGLGIFMVKNLMDEVNYKYINKQNVLTIKKIICESEK